MGIIHVLDKHTANLIAAGEVVERPASAVKEMLENSADAGASRITVEIKNGGTSYFRVTDDGVGMSEEDLPRCVLRHATSKIKEPSDLSAIGTYGFRGEALAAIAAVSDLRILTKRREDPIGHVLHIAGGEVLESGEAGCPDGTTIAASDIFRNIPARRKFLKKDSSEASACLAVCEKFALSRPHIAVTLLSDGAEKLRTEGDGILKNAIYSCLGKDFAAKLIPVNYEHEGISVTGYIGKPETARPSRGLQNFFINNRYVRSGTICAALEEGYRAFCPIGKFPAAVLFCTLDPHRVDVNIHPAKTEVKFSEEKAVFETVLFAVRSALNKGTVFERAPARTETDFSKAMTESLGIKKAPTQSTSLYRREDEKKAAVPTEKAESESKNESQTASASVPAFPPAAENVPSVSPMTDMPPTEKVPSVPPVSEVSPTRSAPPAPEAFSAPDFRSAFSDESEGVSDFRSPNPAPNAVHTPNLFGNASEPEPFVRPSLDLSALSVPTPPIHAEEPPAPPSEPIQQTLEPSEPEEQSPRFRVIGECFHTFILVERGDTLYLIDKHAAHERILYEEIKSCSEGRGAQILLEPIRIRLSTEEYAALTENKELFSGTGFLFDDFGEGVILLRSFPEHLEMRDLPDIITSLAAKLCEGGVHAGSDLFDRALFTAACKAAVKAGQRNSYLQDEYIAKKIFSDEAILYCPHGRPVLTEFTKDKLYRIFKRT